MKSSETVSTPNGCVWRPVDEHVRLLREIVQALAKIVGAARRQFVTYRCHWGMQWHRLAFWSPAAIKGRLAGSGLPGMEHDMRRSGHSERRAARQLRANPGHLGVRDSFFGRGHALYANCSNRAGRDQPPSSPCL